MTKDQMMAQLEDQGYVIVPDVITTEQCDQLYQGFWDWLTAMNPQLNREDRKTWTKDNLPLNTKGLIQHTNVAFQRFTVDAHMWLKPLFKELWGTDQLWSSFDGVSFTTKGKKPTFKSVEDWRDRAWDKTAVHVDQTTPGFMSVQGGLAVLDQHEDQHVFVCVPQSHKYHEELLALGPADKQLHWEIQNEAQIAFMKEKGLKQTRVPLKRGSVVLWDSRLVHASAPHCKTAPEDSTRLQIFVCMKPALTDEAEVNKEMATRKRAYEEGRVSKHSADKIRLFSKRPRMYSKQDVATHEKMQIQPSIVLTDEEKKVYGLAKYD